MTHEEKEGNKLIRDFMQHNLYAVRIRYDQNWNQLMPVLEKIEGMGHKTVLATSDWGSKYYLNIMTGVGIMKETIDNPSKFMGQSDDKRKAVWLAVVPFIKWYNTQNTK